MNKQHVQRIEQNVALSFHFKNDITGETVCANVSAHTAAKLEAALAETGSGNTLGFWHLAAVARSARR